MNIKELKIYEENCRKKGGEFTIEGLKQYHRDKKRKLSN